MGTQWGGRFQRASLQCFEMQAVQPLHHWQPQLGARWAVLPSFQSEILQKRPSCQLITEIGQQTVKGVGEGGVGVRISIGQNHCA